MKFEWDEDKNRSNIIKHGISFQDASYVFSDPFALSISDDYSENEERWILLGKNSNDTLTLVVHTFRSSNVIRLISARKATKHECYGYTKRLSK